MLAENEKTNLNKLILDIQLNLQNLITSKNEYDINKDKKTEEKNAAKSESDEAYNTNKNNFSAKLTAEKTKNKDKIKNADDAYKTSSEIYQKKAKFDEIEKTISSYIYNIDNNFNLLRNSSIQLQLSLNSLIDTYTGQKKQIKI